MSKPSAEKPWLKYYLEGADKTPIPEMTAYQYLRERNRGYENGIAIIYFGAKITYNEFFKRIDDTANSFAALGVKKGSFVTICMPNTPEGVICFYALNKIGAVANMITPFFAHEHITQCLKRTESELIIILDKFYAMIDGVIAQTDIKNIIIVSPFYSAPPIVKLLGRFKSKPVKLPRGGGFFNWKMFIDKGKGINAAAVPYKNTSPAVIVYSSGSTGASKGIMLPNEAFTGVCVQVENMGIYWKRGQGQKKHLGIGPLFISTGLNVCINLTLCLNDTLILEPVFDGDVFAKRMKQHKADYTLTTPSHFERLLQHDLGDLSNLRLPIAGGEALPQPLEAALNDYLKKHNAKVKMMKGWGMCEYGSGVTLTLGNDQNRKGAGKPLPLAVIGAFDTDTDAELGYNERGELRVCTPCRMIGYYKNPEGTAEFFKEGKDGRVWGHSGDMGYIDHEGNVFIEGRAHDFIRGDGGRKVWLFDIENALLTDPSVQFCEVVGLDDTPYAHLVLKQGVTETPPEIISRLHKLCADTLPPDAMPKGYKIRDGFNVLPSGKRDTLSLKGERTGFVTP